MSETSVPAVPAGAGPRLFMVLAVLTGLFGLGFLFAAAVGTPAALANVVGLADTDTAQVTERSLHESGRPRKGCAARYEYDVVWADREGHFSECVLKADPQGFEVGDEVVVRSVPWSSTVSPEGEEGATFWAVTFLVLGLWLPVLGTVWFLRYRRLVRGTATGELFTGSVSAESRSSVSVLIGDRRLSLAPLKPVHVGVGDPAQVWSTRRSLLRKRPRGPWVMRARGQLGVYTHGWWRQPR